MSVMVPWELTALTFNGSAYTGWTEQPAPVQEKLEYDHLKIMENQTNGRKKEKLK